MTDTSFAGLSLLVVILVVVGWLVGTVWGYRRAVDAGYSELAALVGALLLGIFAPLMAFVKPHGKRCAFCRSVIDPKATVCPKCTREQPAAEAKTEAPPPPPARVSGNGAILGGLGVLLLLGGVVALMMVSSKPAAVAPIAIPATAPPPTEAPAGTPTPDPTAVAWVQSFNEKLGATTQSGPTLPNGYGGLRWGDPEPKSGFVFVAATADGLKSYRKERDRPTFGGVEVFDALYVWKRGAFLGVRFEAAPEKYDALVNAATKMWGEQSPEAAGARRVAWLSEKSVAFVDRDSETGRVRVTLGTAE